MKCQLSLLLFYFCTMSSGSGKVLVRHGGQFPLDRSHDSIRLMFKSLQGQKLLWPTRAPPFLEQSSLALAFQHFRPVT